MGEFNRIAFSGKMCSGKTTAANMLMHEFGYSRMFFAEELKILCRDIANYNKAAGSGLEAELRKPLLKIIWDDLERITVTEEEYNVAVQQVLSIIEKYKHVTYYDPNSDKKTDEIRDMLQEVGTAYLRSNVNQEIWVNAVEKRIHTADVPLIVVDDVRYVNEYEMLRRNGFVMVRLNVSRDIQERRMKRLYGHVDESKFMHASEVALDHMSFDYVIDSDQSLDSMLHDVRSLLGGS